MTILRTFAQFWKHSTRFAKQGNNVRVSDFNWQIECKANIRHRNSRELSAFLSKKVLKVFW
ncbi:MAG: hypothetical protein CMJ64_03170 [Planctomycetaceae bacterium]|nr:hypothetical protein [Planctomycetaceae bacterium]